MMGFILDPSHTSLPEYIVRLPQGRRGVLSPNHVTPVSFYILDLKDPEKLGVTFRTRCFLLENLKNLLKNYIFLEKIRKFVFAHGAG